MTVKTNKNIEITKNSEFGIKIISKYNAGICLSGNEIKSVRLKSVSIRNSYILVRNLEVYIFGMFIKKYENSNSSVLEEKERRVRKLLLKKSEIKKISKSVKERGHMIIPLKVFISSEKWAKIEIAVSQRKKIYQIKKDQKEKDLKREINNKQKYF